MKLPWVRSMPERYAEELERERQILCQFERLLIIIVYKWKACLLNMNHNTDLTVLSQPKLRSDFYLFTKSSISYHGSTRIPHSNSVRIQ